MEIGTAHSKIEIKDPLTCKARAFEGKRHRSDEIKSSIGLDKETNED